MLLCSKFPSPVGGCEADGVEMTSKPSISNICTFSAANPSTLRLTVGLISGIEIVI
ncbi:MAG: hypothetical protein KIT33_00710 [Candidatus Kapabacteria bacterium]|nr:hypothetical protein [Ignavibacteriota bacterium]MCW5883467.1 hypothetical protein [Candidatus Kapabacteria bacterium]